MRISSLIFLSFSLILMLFAITTYLNFRQSEKVKENADYLSSSTTIIRSSNRFQRNILNMVSGLRGFLLTGEDYFLQSYDTAALENQSILKELSASFPDTSRQHNLLSEIEQLNTRWLNDFAAPLRQAKIRAEASDKNIAGFNELYRQKMKASNERELNLDLQQKIREFINLEYDRREREKSFLANSSSKTRAITFTLTIASVIAAFFIVSFITYRISSRVLKMVKMANSIAEGNYEVHTEITGKDELSRLAHSLNSMARVLSQNISELKRKNSELDQFAHIVSHDMKAPLRGIDNVVGWIEEDHSHELSPKMTEYLGLIKGRTQRGENLIQGLLSYARVGKEETPEEEVDVKALVEEVAENIPGKSNCTIYADHELPVLNTERLPLFQVFYNLISNAVKYNDHPNGRVSISAEEHPSWYRFIVKDNGPGISRNYHEKIFVIFQTLHENDNPESTGVGLAIVKKILDARQEQITLKSAPGEGSSFSFTWKK